MQRIAVGRLSTISTTFYGDESALEADDDVTVTVTNSAGDVIVDAATATAATDGSYTYTFTSATAPAVVDVLTAEWSGVFAGDALTRTETVEVAGGFYVELAELRALKNLEDDYKFPTAQLAAARQWFEDKFERATGVAWVPRYTTTTVNGNGTSTLLLDVMQVRAVRSVQAYTAADTYTEFTEAELADLGVYASGELRRLYLGAFTYGNRNYVLEVEHGYDEPPADVREAALIAIRDKVLGNETGNRVYATQTSDGIIRQSTPGAATPFGIPEVDEVVQARNHGCPAVA